MEPAVFKKEYQQTVFKWYPFSKGSRILYLGNRQQLFEQALENLNLEIDSDTKGDKYDYIVLDHYLDFISDKKSALNRLFKLKKDTGSMLIFAENPIGFQQMLIHPEMIESVEVRSPKKDLLPYRKWIELIGELNSPWEAAAAYPDDIYPEYLFFKDPKIEDITRPVFNVSGQNLKIKNEADVLKQAVDSDAFLDLANSFVFVLSPDNEIEYVKFACERRPKYRILTKIISSADSKKVMKIPFTRDAEAHIQNVLKFYETVKAAPAVFNQYCPVSSEADGISFPFVHGDSLESQIQKAVDDHDTGQVLKLIDSAYDLTLTSETVPFRVSDDFLRVFGPVNDQLLKDEEACRVNNIDLIFQNILIDNDQYQVIDYEWSYLFPIPRKFILYRALFHSPAVSMLPKNERKEIFEHYGINEELFNEFLKMEIRFQKHVSEQNLEMIFKEEGNSVQFAVSMNPRPVCTVMYSQNVYKKEFLKDQFKLEMEIPSDGPVEISINTPCILKIKRVESAGSPVHFYTNAELINGSDYYFLQKPLITLPDPGSGLLSIEGQFFYHHCDNVVSNITDLTMKLFDEIHAKQMESNNLTQSESAAAVLIKENEELWKRTTIAEQELQKMNTNFLVRVFRKLRLI